MGIPTIIRLLSDYPVFCSNDALTPTIVVKIASAAGISKTISPHRIRHSSVTAALDASKGDVRSVQKLSPGCEFRHPDDLR
ncbi:phage integrase family protein (plasmid) [Calothrix sp. NIES-4071]|nr:phage integrase family protein [Calothrix sp. NIES-4071]BAZ64750.1 phage integrase family protein [Calothrix sp. NIES-4105]